MNSPAMLLFWNCLQINRPNTGTLTVVRTRLYFASDRVPCAPNDRLPAPPFGVGRGGGELFQLAGTDFGELEVGVN